jgi:hypothetical protein
MSSDSLDYIFNSGPYSGTIPNRENGAAAPLREEPAMATSIAVNRSVLKNRAEALEAQLREIQKGLASLVPDEPVGLGTVIRFKKFNRQYSYAAIKVGDEWYLTQNPNRPQDRKLPKTWDELLDFVGERNWETVEVLS